MNFRGVKCSILDVVAIFDNTFNDVFSQNFNMSGYGIKSTWNSPWNPCGIHGGDGMRK